MTRHGIAQVPCLEYLSFSLDSAYYQGMLGKLTKEGLIPENYLVKVDVFSSAH